jgi:predicted small secreted protein
MKRNIWILVLAFALAASLTACKKEEEGTMEKMGKAVDSAVHDTKDTVEEAAKDAGRAIEDAAEEVEEAVEDAKD